MISADKEFSLSRVITEWKSGAICPLTVERWRVKCLNHVTEGDRGRLKSLLGSKGAYKNRVSAYRMLERREAIHSACEKGKAQCVTSRRLNLNTVIVRRAFETI